MKFIKKIIVECNNSDFEYAKKIKDGINYFSELCTDYDIKCGGKPVRFIRYAVKGQTVFFQNLWNTLKIVLNKSRISALFYAICTNFIL